MLLGQSFGKMHLFRWRTNSDLHWHPTAQIEKHGWVIVLGSHVIGQSVPQVLKISFSWHSGKSKIYSKISWETIRIQITSIPDVFA